MSLRSEMLMVLDLSLVVDQCDVALPGWGVLPYIVLCVKPYLVIGGPASFWQHNTS
jgi:hypothetical protein